MNSAFFPLGYVHSSNVVCCSSPQWYCWSAPINAFNGAARVENDCVNLLQYEQSCTKLLTSVKFFGTGHFWIADTFSFVGLTPSWVTWNPKHSTEVLNKLHLAGFNFKFALFNRWKMSLSLFNVECHYIKSIKIMYLVPSKTSGYSWLRSDFCFALKWIVAHHDVANVTMTLGFRRPRLMPKIA